MKKQVLFALAALAVAGLLLCVFYSEWNSTSLRQVVAQNLGVDYADGLELNIPGNFVREPGLVFIKNHTFVPIKDLTTDTKHLVEPAVIPPNGGVLRFTGIATVDSTGHLGFPLGKIGASKGKNVEVDFEIKNLKARELKDENIMAHLKAPDIAKLKEHKHLFLILRSYEGEVKCTLKRRVQGSASGKFDQNLQSSDATKQLIGNAIPFAQDLQAEGEITSSLESKSEYDSGGPIVFAYEVLNIPGFVNYNTLGDLRLKMQTEVLKPEDLRDLLQSSSD